jgi:hypothetical protein
MDELRNSPKQENKILEDKVYSIKERALQRTIQINLEIKKKTDWTMPKLVENVITKKQREREEKLKEIEQRRIAKALRHQLAHHNMLSGIGQWLTKRLGTFTQKLNKNKDIEEDNLSSTTSEDLRVKSPVIIPAFSL